MAEILTMVAKMSRAGSKIWDTFVRSIFHSTLEWLLFPGSSHCSRDASWLAVKFSSCMWDRGWSYVNSIWDETLHSNLHQTYCCSPVHMHMSPKWNCRKCPSKWPSETAGQSWQYISKHVSSDISCLCLIKEPKQRPTNYLSISLQTWEAVKNRRKKHFRLFSVMQYSKCSQNI